MRYLIKGPDGAPLAYTDTPFEDEDGRYTYVPTIEGTTELAAELSQIDIKACQLVAFLWAQGKPAGVDDVTDSILETDGELQANLMELIR